MMFNISALQIQLWSVSLSSPSRSQPSFESDRETLQYDQNILALIHVLTDMLRPHCLFPSAIMWTILSQLYKLLSLFFVLFCTVEYSPCHYNF